MMEQTDGRTTDRYIDPPTRMQGASIKHSTRSTRQKERERKREREVGDSMAVSVLYTKLLICHVHTVHHLAAKYVVGN